MRIVSPRAEAQALKGMCSKNPAIAGSLLARLNPTYFFSPAAREAHRRVMKFYAAKGEVPPLSMLREDLGLSEKAKEFLSLDVKVPKETREVDHLVAVLDKYRRTRLLYTTCKQVMEELSGSTADIDDLQEILVKGITEIQSKGFEEADVVHIGKEGNALEIIKEILYGEQENLVIPTGFSTFDERNGGFFRGSLVGIAGTTGGGKSLLANQLAVNNALYGYKSIMIPLEMGRDENLARTMAGQSGFDSLDIFLKRLATGEKDLIYKKMKRFQRLIESKGGRYSVIKPKQDVTMEEILSLCHTYNPDVIYLDYLNLLSGVSESEDSWRKLAGAARRAKVYAEIHHKVVVILTQLNADGAVRYSQGVSEHCNSLWSFVSTPEIREAGYMHIVPIKSRNQDPFPFVLRADYKTMKVDDLPKEEMETAKAKVAEAKAKPEGTKHASRAPQKKFTAPKSPRKESEIEGV